MSSWKLSTWRGLTVHLLHANHGNCSWFWQVSHHTYHAWDFKHQVELCILKASHIFKGIQALLQFRSRTGWTSSSHNRQFRIKLRLYLSLHSLLFNYKGWSVCTTECQIFINTKTNFKVPKQLNLGKPSNKKAFTTRSDKRRAVPNRKRDHNWQKHQHFPCTSMASVHAQALGPRHCHL